MANPQQPGVGNQAVQEEAHGFFYHLTPDSFKRYPGSEDPNSDLQDAMERNLNSYHCQLIALGSAIGTGLFIATGQGLSISGPGPLLGAFIFVGFALCPTIMALGEMATFMPVPGGFFEHARILTDEALGAAVGWK